MGSAYDQFSRDELPAILESQSGHDPRAISRAPPSGERCRQMIEELRASQERRALTAAAFEGIGISEKGVMVDVNDQLAGLLGYTREELIGTEVTFEVHFPTATAE